MADDLLFDDILKVWSCRQMRVHHVLAGWLGLIQFWVIDGWVCCLLVSRIPNPGCQRQPCCNCLTLGLGNSRMGNNKEEWMN